MKYDNKIRSHVIYVNNHGYVMNKPNGGDYRFTQNRQHARVYGSSGAAANSANFVADQLGLASYSKDIQIVPVVLVEVR